MSRRRRLSFKGGLKVEEEGLALGGARLVLCVKLALGFQDGFDEFAGLHAVEAALPFGQRSDAAEDGVHVELAGDEHAEDFFPHRPVVTEAAFERDGFLDEQVEREIAGLRAPAYLADLAIRADPFHRAAQGGAYAGGIDDDVDAVTVAAVFDELVDVFAVGSERVSCADLRANSRRLASALVPTTISGLAPQSLAIAAQSRPIGPGPMTTTLSPGLMWALLTTAL